MTNHPKIRQFLFVLLAVLASFGLAACGSDGDEGDDGASSSEEQSSDGSDASNDDGSGSGSSDSVDASTATTGSTVAPQPELSVPALVGENASNVTVGGYIFEDDGVFLLCETATDTDPPECDGETIEISNGEVIDPSIFLGEPGSMYSDAEVVVTGDVADGVLTIG